MGELVSRSLTLADLITIPGLTTPGTILYVDAANGNDGNDGDGWNNAKATIQSAIDAASSGDRILIAPAGDDTAYVEELTITTSNLTLIGMGSRGSVTVEPSGTNATALLIDGSAARRTDIQLVNLEFGGAGNEGGLHVQGNVRRIRAYGCTFAGEAAGSGFDVRLESTGDGAVADCSFHNCEFKFGDTAFHFKVSGGGDPVTQTYIGNCRFHNFATVGVHAETTHTADVWIEDCFFGDNEDGSQPTDFLLLNVASTTGLVAGCKFATATNASGVLTIAAGVHWGANVTEAGHSTARPA